MFKKITVAFDESPEAERAFHYALNLAKEASAELSIITVIEDYPAYMSYVFAAAPEVPSLLNYQRRSFYTDMHNRAKREAEQAGISLRTEMTQGDEAKGLLSLIDLIKPDLLVVGLSRNPSEMSRILGGTAHQLALQAKCNILGVH